MNVTQARVEKWKKVERSIVKESINPSGEQNFNETNEEVAYDNLLILTRESKCSKERLKTD